MTMIERFICGPLQNNVYVLHGGESSECALVDPAAGMDEAVDFITRHKLQVKYILLTHGHFDHAFMLGEMVKMYGAPVALHSADSEVLERLPEVAERWGFGPTDAPPQPEIDLATTTEFEINAERITVRHTPGHSPGQVAFVFPGHAVVGDTLFYRGIGRYDLPGSDYDSLITSIEQKLYSLPKDTVVWPGHGPETTIEEEMRLNPYVGAGARFRPRL